MSLIVIFNDGIKFSYSLIILIVTIAIWLGFMNINKEKKYNISSKENIRYQSEYKMTICVRRGKFNNKSVKYILH